MVRVGEVRAGRSWAPSPVPSCGPGSRKNGHVGTDGGSKLGQSGRRERFCQRVVREPERRRGIGAPAGEPCRDRDALLDRDVPGGRDLAACASRGSAAATSVSSANPVTRRLSAGSSTSESARSTRCSTVATSCLPSSRRGPTTSARLIFAGADALVIATSPVSSTNCSGRSASARTVGPRPSSGQRGGGALPARDSRQVERVRQGLPPMRERSLNRCA